MLLAPTIVHGSKQTTDHTEVNQPSHTGLVTAQTSWTSKFQPPDNGNRHRILVVDESIWGFITAEGNDPTHILAQTPYRLNQHDRAIWGQPIANGPEHFYTLLIARWYQDPDQRSNRWTTGPIVGDANRRDAAIEVNWQTYQELLAESRMNVDDWSFWQPPEHSLLNIVRITEQATIYVADPELTNGKSVLRDSGQPQIDREFQVLTKIDGVAIDRQAIGGWTIMKTKPTVIAIGVKYNRNKDVPEWQRPILAELAGVNLNDWEYVDYIMYRESSWRPFLANQSSGAYGVCQSLPAHKMASAGNDYLTNVLTQLRWCHDYAERRYGDWEQA